MVDDYFQISTRRQNIQYCSISVNDRYMTNIMSRILTSPRSDRLSFTATRWIIKTAHQRYRHLLLINGDIVDGRPYIKQASSTITTNYKTNQTSTVSRREHSP